MILKTMGLETAAGAILALCLAVPVVAQNAPPQDAVPDSSGGRYVFSKQADGFVRLDSQTGEVALCSQKAVGMACEAAPEDRALLENEIARLRRENGALKKDILAHGLPLPPGATLEPPVAENGGSTLRLPSDSDIDRMVAFADRVWHRLVEALERAQKQVLNRS
ncbi:MAG: hypothetical protein ABSE22_00125 [Xanthobacteraceae bacterium]|jgi:hypothetical protein